MVRRTLLAACGAALLVLAVVLSFAGSDDELRMGLRDAAMSAAGTGARALPIPPAAELLLLDETGLVLRGPAALQGTRLQLDAVRSAPSDGQGVAIERWPDGDAWLTAFAATRRSTANAMRIAVVRHKPDRGLALRASPWIAGAAGVLLLGAAFAPRRRAAQHGVPATDADASQAANVVRLEPRASRLAQSDELPLLLDQVVVEEAPMLDAVTAAIARMPFSSMPLDEMPVDEQGEVRRIELDAETPLFNDAPLLAMQRAVPPDTFERVLHARLADAARRVRILEVAAAAGDVLTLQRESSDLAEFAATFGAPALREAVSLVQQVAELQLTSAYRSAVAQVEELSRKTEDAITARFIARSDRTA